MPQSSKTESSPGKTIHNRRLDKQNPEIALKILRFLKTNPDCFNAKWRALNYNEFRRFVKYLVTDCGCDMYLKRVEDPNWMKHLKGIYERLKKW